MTGVSLTAARSQPGPGLTPLLLAGLALASVLSMTMGAAGIGPLRLLAALQGEALSLSEAVVLYDIRLPRLAMGLLVGAALGLSGALLQGLFRNPLADPGIVGVSAGAGLGAVLAIVLGGLLPSAVLTLAGTHLVSLCACLGGWLFTMILYHVASAGGRTQVATLLLAGIAMGALAGAATGVLIYLADDRQLRDLTFWSMGSLAGATWGKLLAILPLIGGVLALSPRLGRGLNALALGEAQALHMGVDVQRLKRLTVLATALATGAAVAVSGGIGFVGIVVPHLLRLARGPDHRHLLPQSAMLGAMLLVLADLLSRQIVAPAELPIGIITALLGAPVFLWILLRQTNALRG